MQLDVCEIFYSLQGESTFAGLPCIFIRLSGCNLNCTWCDTGYAGQDSTPMEIDRILEKIQTYNCSLVEITGGEPLLQKNTPALASILLENGYQVLVETNGSISIHTLPQGCIRILDIKCPSSNEAESFLKDNYQFLDPDDEIKFVIGTRKDYDYAKSIIHDELSGFSKKKIHLSPVFGHILPEQLAEWLLEDNLQARLSLQQHKIIWGPDKKGV